MATTKKTPTKCDCHDGCCPVHRHHVECYNKATTRLYRIDMMDYHGVLFCDRCANDALESGLFNTHA